MQALSGMVVYFIVMNDYGFKPATLLFLNLAPGYVPNPEDIYDPTAANYGNSGFPLNSLSALSWGSNEGSSMDLRLFYTQLAPEAWAPCQY
jgi:hypothetical protein